MTKLTILIAPADGSGHFNACTGIGQILQNRGHRVVFIAKRSSWQGKLAALGFEEELYDEDTLAALGSEEELYDEDTLAALGSEEKLYDEDTQQEKISWTQSMITNIAPYLRQSPIDHHKGYGRTKWSLLTNIAKKENHIFQLIIRKVKPNVILIDNLAVSPSLITSGIPWIRVVSSQVLYAIDDERTPPTGSGYAINSSKDLWHKYRQLCNELYEDIWNQYNQYMISEGAPPLPHLKLMYSSPFANFYMYPKEIDYTDIRPLPPKWHQFDNFLRTSDKECDNFELPREFIEKSGKLIYFSMGSIACADLQLMDRLIAILSESPNKFIVSKGPFAEQLTLGDNMWGKEYVPQVKVLELVDLVITHGGNNTITELFYYGKPIIVLPIFSDQFDNAQRIQETGFGLTVNPYHCQPQELLTAIDTALNDDEMIFKINQAGRRIRSEQKENCVRLAELVESIAK